MRARIALTAVAAVAALLLTGCVDNAPAADSSQGNDPARTVKPDAAAVELLPSSVAKSGTLIIGTSPNYAPNEFRDKAGKPIGWAIELSAAVAGKLGLEADVTIARFESIIPRIEGGTINLGESSFTDTLAREEKVDFVNYFVAGTQWASATGKSVDPDNACGLKVAVQATTAQETVEIPAKSAACVAAGKAPIEKLAYDTQDAAFNAVAIEQADAVSADSTVTLYGIEKLKGKLQPAGKTFEASPYGFAVKKDSGMAEAVQAAVQSLVDDGTYGKILEDWGVSSGGIDKVTINAAIS